MQIYEAQSLGLVRTSATATRSQKSPPRGKSEPH